LKIVSKLSWVSIIVFLVSCAPKRIEVPFYEGRPFREVLSGLNDISEIDAKLSLAFEKSDAEIKGDAALHVSRDGDMSLRVYSLGFLAMELTSENDVVRSNPHLDKSKAMILTQGIRDCLFWWDVRDSAVEDDGEYFIIKNSVRRVWIDKKTFLPKRQKIFFDEGKELTIYYDTPARENDIWYQSKIRIELSKYSVTLAVQKITFKSGLQNRAKFTK
jgi:hypothetical protein